MEIVDTYLALLRAALWGESEARLEMNDERLGEVVRLAAFQGTGPLVYDQLLKLKDVDIPADLRMLMKQQCVHSMMLLQSMVPLLSQAWNALVAADIHPVLLKGFSIAQYYPLPHLRQWGDIDLYVGQKNYHKACAILRQTFPDSEYGEIEDEDDKHYNFDFPNTAIETHRVSMTFAHPRDRRYYEGLEEKCMTKDGLKFEIEGLELTMPEETFNVFFVFLHAWHHFVETGMNMKQVCDVAVLLHAKHDEIDRVQLKKMLTKLHLMEVWQLLMYIIVQYLGLSQAEAPFYDEGCKDRSELLYERILKEGSSRQAEKLNADGASYLKRKWITFQSRMADSRLLKPYAPRYARHMAWSNILHGIERTIKGSEKAVNVECV